MSAIVRAYYLDSKHSGFSSVKSAIDALEQVSVVGVYDQWEQLQNALGAQSVEAIVLRWDALAHPELLCRRILELAPKTAIVCLSANADSDTIIAAMRAGCSQFVRVPIDAQDLAGAFERIRALSAPAAANVHQRIGVLGSAGGAGATTLACNLAAEIAQLTNQPTAIVDLNLELGDVACAFDCEPKHSIADVCREGVEVDRAMLENAIEKLPDNVYLLARPQKIEDVYQISSDGISSMLDIFGELCPYTIIDLPRLMFSVTETAVSHVDRFLIVMQLAVPYVRNTMRILEFLCHVGVQNERVEVVVNRTQASHERMTIAEVEKHLKRSVFAQIPNDYKRVTESRDLGHSIVYGAPNSPARLAIQQIARKLLGATELQQKQNRGLFKKLLGRRA